MTGRLVGYIRVSTVTQTHDQQRDALMAVGVQPRDIFAEKISGAAKDRPEFDRMLAYVEPGDTIVVSSFDRFGRDLARIITTVADLTSRGIVLRSLREGHDTSTPAGKLVLAIFAALAEYERTLIAERTAVARAAAKRRGKNGGKPRKLTAEQVEMARYLLSQTKPNPDYPDGRPVRKWTAQQVATQVGCGRSTMYHYLAEPEQVLQATA